ncbi:LysR family transcriptional regulator [Achromobacter insolitus]|uniref:LysR family transcriptional regulator n=1 Tax=Achromobacter TaxID=222 RepID=UPI000972DC00|nr:MULTISPECIES: LysR family transcriptional regulator [Achromobacter]APX75719.1 LysR family transcriptional regulator [Achromobacter insolitus]MDQ6214468.1 LysR family transcriptional regulator [Achromobacter insolitus]MEB3098279.1 LysR family transcriptional regulator [Achromobacter sp. D10]OWT59892.1 LysR family transcriptional regulator [Achromobacter insolitus]WKK19246.1 LysR family transcriptional regulator [Achromobacter insolitus]
MDWDNARIFLAIYRVGTLRGAAALLQIDQATAGRRLAALESSLDARLFLRTPGGYVPTAAGELAFAAAERMEQAADQLQRQMQGLDHRLSGGVRVATSETVASYYVLEAVRRVHTHHPDIRVTLSTAIQLSNLTRREADLAIRNIRPDNPDLIYRHLARKEVGLYASRTYLEAHGEPRLGTAFAGHALVTYQQAVLPGWSDTFCGEPTGNGRIGVELNSGMMIIEAVVAGLGIGQVPIHMAPLYPDLVRIWPTRSEPYDLWLVMHGDLNRTARVRAVADAIVEVFEEDK